MATSEYLCYRTKPTHVSRPKILTRMRSKEQKRGFHVNLKVILCFYMRVKLKETEDFCCLPSQLVLILATNFAEDETPIYAPFITKKKTFCFIFSQQSKTMPTHGKHLAMPRKFFCFATVSAILPTFLRAIIKKEKIESFKKLLVP